MCVCVIGQRRYNDFAVVRDISGDCLDLFQVAGERVQLLCRLMADESVSGEVCIVGEESLQDQEEK